MRHALRSTFCFAILLYVISAILYWCGVGNAQGLVELPIYVLIGFFAGYMTREGE